MENNQYQYPNDNGQYNYQPPTQPPTNNQVGFAVTSMVLGIVALLLSCCAPSWLVVILAIIGIIFGAISLKQQRGGKGMAVAGLVCSIIAFASKLIFALVIGASITSLMSSLS